MNDDSITISKDDILNNVQVINPLVYELAIERARTQKLQQYIANLEQKAAEESTESTKVEDKSVEDRFGRSDPTS